MAAPVQPAAAAAAALSAATAIPPPTSVQQKLEMMQARTESRYRDRPPLDHHPDDDKDDGQGEYSRAHTSCPCYPLIICGDIFRLVISQYRLVIFFQTFPHSLSSLT